MAWTACPAPPDTAWVPCVWKTPVLSSLSPDSAVQDDTTAVTLVGENFSPDSQVLVSGAGITVQNVVVVDPFTITADLVVAVGAAAGSRNVTVEAAGGTSNALPLEVTFLDYYSLFETFDYAVGTLPNGPRWLRKGNASAWSVESDAGADAGKIARSPSSSGTDIIQQAQLPDGTAIAASISQRVSAKVRIVDTTRDRASVILRSTPNGQFGLIVVADGTNFFVQQYSSHAVIATTPYVAANGVWLRIKAEALESTQRLKAKVWVDGAAEPADWMLDVAIPDVTVSAENSLTTPSRWGLSNSWISAFATQMDCDIFSADTTAG